jgi:hypothetical protein
MVKGQRMNWPKDHIKISDLSCGLPPFGRVPSFGMWIVDWGRHKEWGNNFEFRIANLKTRRQESESRMKNQKANTFFLLATDY